MSVPRQKKSTLGISGNAEPFSKQEGTSIIQAQTAKIEKLLALRNEVYAINPEAICKKDIAKIAQYALGLCGLSIEERKTVIFANEPIVKTLRAGVVNVRDCANTDENVQLQSMRYTKWDIIDTGRDPHNALSPYHWNSFSPKIKLLALIYTLETNTHNEMMLHYNVIGTEKRYRLGNLVDSPESAVRIYFSALAVAIIDTKELSKKNLQDRDFGYMYALNQCEMQIDSEKYKPGFDAVQGSIVPYLKKMYARLDSIKEQAQKILES